MKEKDHQQNQDPSFAQFSAANPASEGGTPLDELEVDRLQLDGLEATVAENEASVSVVDSKNSASESVVSAAQSELERRATLRSVMQHLDTGLQESLEQIISLDRQWRYTHINEKVVEATGLSEPELVGRRIWDVFPDLVGTSFYQQVQQALDNQSVTHFEYFYPAWNQWFDNWVYPTEQGLTLLVSDISYYKQAQESLRLHTHILESIAEGVVISDETGVIVFANATFEQMFGYERGELLGLPLTVLNDLPPDDNQRLVDKILATLQQEGRWVGELANLQKDGTPFTTEAHASALQVEDKTYLIGIQQDITERKRTEQRVATQCAVACCLAEATTLDAAVPEILRSLCQGLGWQLAALWLVDPLTQQLYCRQSWHAPTLNTGEFGDISRTITFTAGVGLPGQIWASQQPTWIVEIQDSNFPRAAWAYQTGLRSAFGFPILAGRDCLGVIECYSDRRQPADTNLQHCVVGIGGQIGQFIERLRDKHALRQSEERYRSIFETVGIALWEEDFSEVKALLDDIEQQGVVNLREYLHHHLEVVEEAIQRVRIRDVNQQTLKLFGAQTKSELLVSLTTIFVPETVQIFVEEMVAIAEGSSYFEAETILQTLQGERRHVLFSITFPTSGTGYERVLVSVLDISDRVRAEQECQRLLQQERMAREAAEASNRIKDEFLSVLSHELRTPLNPILGWSALLQRGHLSEQETTLAIETIACSARRQLQLVTDLLDVSHILQGKFHLAVCPVDLSGTITTVLQTAQVAAQAKSIQIQTRFAPEVGLVLGDPARLQQIIWNLLSNAIKFTANAGRVDIQLEQIEDQVQVSVTDTGKGIASDLLPYLFQRFYQEDLSGAEKS